MSALRKINNLGKVLTHLHKRMIILELFSIFTVSVVVTIIRLHESIFGVFTKYPGQPKIIILPFVWYVAIYTNGGWNREIFLNSDAFYSRIIKSGFHALIGFSSIAFLIKLPIPRSWVVLNIAAITFALLSIRYVFRKLLTKKIPSPNDLKFILIGQESETQKNISIFDSNFGFKPCFTTLLPPNEANTSAWLDSYKKLVNDNFYGVLVTYAAISDAEILKEISNYRRSQVIEMIVVSKIAPIVPRFELLDNPTLIRISENKISNIGRVPKRILDVVFASFGLIVTFPIILIAGVAIKFSSPGPIFFMQKRVGKGGKLFTFPKLRTMYVDSEISRSKVIGSPDHDISRRYKEDPRITPVGRFLRRWSIDELPQFWNVLNGSMSIVGPRPILIEEQNLISTVSEVWSSTKPGLTGLWQVTGRKEVSWEDRVLRDIYYIENWSLWKDIVLILRTIGAIIKGEGAY